jgi:hypothetical protein
MKQPAAAEMIRLLAEAERHAEEKEEREKQEAEHRGHVASIAFSLRMIEQHVQQMRHDLVNGNAHVRLAK